MWGRPLWSPRCRWTRCASRATTGATTRVAPRVAPTGRRLAFAVRPGSDLGNRFAGKFVGAFVEIVTGMTAHPMPMHSVAADRGLESLPQIRVLDRLLVAGPPAVA